MVVVSVKQWLNLHRQVWTHPMHSHCTDPGIAQLLFTAVVLLFHTVLTLFQLYTGAAEVFGNFCMKMEKGNAETLNITSTQLSENDTFLLY